MNEVALRSIIFVVVFGLVVTLPWWLSIFILIGLTIYFPVYLEVIFFGLLFDVLYSAKLSFPYTAGVLALFFLLLVSFLRKYIRT